jgi:hypothetical protein
MPRRQTTEKAPAEVEVDRDEQPAQLSAASINNLKIRLVSPLQVRCWHELPGHSEDLTAVTFQIQDEDHTLGNALRYIIMKK